MFITCTVAEYRVKHYKVLWALLLKYPEIFSGLLVQWAIAHRETQAVQTAGQSDAEY